jgi:hypothetical protein
MNSMALLGMSGVEVDQTERERLLETIASEGRAAAGSHMEGATLAFDMTANVARAH